MNKWLHITIILLLLLLAWFLSVGNNPPQNFRELWITKDQQGQQEMLRRNYSEAAALFTDPMRKGVAYYRNGDFKEAATVFSSIPSPDADYNKANSLVMVGKYQEAIESYMRVLDADPGHKAAIHNLKIAKARRAIMDSAPDSEHKGTGGKLGADEIVFDDRGKKGQIIQEDTALKEDESANDLWLRRIKTTPGDFLKMKFSYQLHTREKRK